MAQVVRDPPREVPHLHPGRVHPGPGHLWHIAGETLTLRTKNDAPTNYCPAGPRTAAERPLATCKSATDGLTQYGICTGYTSARGASNGEARAEPVQRNRLTPGACRAISCAGRRGA